jgi:hypothetical protein
MVQGNVPDRYRVKAILQEREQVRSRPGHCHLSNLGKVLMPSGR